MMGTGNDLADLYTGRCFWNLFCKYGKTYLDVTKYDIEVK